MICKSYTYLFLVSMIHTEGCLRVLCHIKVFKLFFAGSFLFTYTNVHHLVHTIMLYFVIPVVKGNHIVVLIIPKKCPRTDCKKTASMPCNQFFINIPFIVLEFNLFVFIDCGVYIVHIVIHTLIHSLYTVIYKNLPLQLLCLMLTYKVFYLCNKYL